MSTSSFSDSAKTMMIAAVTSAISVTGAIVAMTFINPTQPVGAVNTMDTEAVSSEDMQQYMHAYTQGYLASTTTQSGATVGSTHGCNETGSVMGVSTHQSGAVMNGSIGSWNGGGYGAGHHDDGHHDSSWNPSHSYQQWREYQQNVHNNHYTNHSYSYVNSNNNSGNVSGSYNHASSSNTTSVAVTGSENVIVGANGSSETNAMTNVDNSTVIENSGNTTTTTTNTNQTSVENSFNTENTSSTNISNTETNTSTDIDTTTNTISNETNTNIENSYNNQEAVINDDFLPLAI